MSNIAASVDVVVQRRVKQSMKGDSRCHGMTRRVASKQLRQYLFVWATYWVGESRNSKLSPRTRAKGIRSKPQRVLNLGSTDHVSGINIVKDVQR